MARRYFEVFGRLVREGRDVFAMNGRTRRPPLDRMNALLSFLYTLVTADCVAAAEGVGLDPQVGYLHTLRPGRPALALDLMEEFRSVLADRLALTLINRRQLTAGDFEDRPGGAVSLTEKGRRTVLTAYQERKKEEMTHPVVGEKTPFGLLPHVQARLLARICAATGGLSRVPVSLKGEMANAYSDHLRREHDDAGRRTATAASGAGVRRLWPASAAIGVRVFADAGSDGAPSRGCWAKSIRASTVCGSTACPRRSRPSARSTGCSMTSISQGRWYYKCRPRTRSEGEKAGGFAVVGKVDL